MPRSTGASEPGGGEGRGEAPPPIKNGGGHST